MTKDYVNFYENIKEATMRLQYTVVLYEGEPYYVLCLADHKDDGIFRIYLDPIGHKDGCLPHRVMGVPHDFPHSVERGKMMDNWMEQNKQHGVIRKMMNSPAFNKFRPFDLGMCNVKSSVVYLERQPQRHTQQGLTQNMIYQSNVCLEPQKGRGLGAVDMTREPFRDCVLGRYPSANECIKNLLDPDIVNDAVAFHRHFAFVRGPIDTLFLAYKGDIVGHLNRGDTSVVTLSPKFAHTKEVVDATGIFSDIVVR